jgi:hypothetical protein
LPGPDDSDPPEKKVSATTDEAALVPSAEGVPPPPGGSIHIPGGSVNIALMQNPSALASLPPDLQRRVFDGLDKDNERQFELSKMALEAQDRGRTASLQERQEARKQAFDERKHLRQLILLAVGSVGVITTGLYLYLLITHRDQAAAVFFQDCIKVASGALGGGGLTALYKGARKP